MSTEVTERTIEWTRRTLMLLLLHRAMTIAPVRGVKMVTIAVIGKEKSTCQKAWLIPAALVID